MEFAKTLFIVDDDEDDRMLLGEAIRQSVDTLHIVEVESGEKMCRLLDKEQDGARLILIDMNMPRMNGLELLAELRKNTRWRSVPVIMISTTSNPELINKAYKLGVNAFIVKPVSQSGFEWMAQMINFCFISNFALGKLPVSGRNAIWRNLLVIEDNDDHWQLMKTSLTTAIPHIHIDRVANGEMLTEMLSWYAQGRRKPEIILLDLYLPRRQDGLAQLAEIRRFFVEHNLPNIPVIVFSYSNYPQDMDAALGGSANAYLVKPENLSQWPVFLQNLCSIWSNAASLPSYYSN